MKKYTKITRMYVLFLFLQIGQNIAYNYKVVIFKKY